ncbi:MAG: hypothetical protein RLY71_411 [Pseudomonadota bacterium]|jgi:hypothetical protein
MDSCQHFTSEFDTHPGGWGVRAVNAVMLVSLAAALLLVLFAPVAAHAQVRRNDVPPRLEPQREDRWAQDVSVSLYRKRTDQALGRRMRFGSVWKSQVGQGPRLAGMQGGWHGEVQLIRSTGRGPQPYGSNYRRGLWLLNGSSLPLSLHEGTTLTAYSKVGLHYLSGSSAGSPLAGSTSKVRLGVGAGMAWQLPSGSQLSLEVNRIDRSADVVSLGAQLAF